MGHMNKSRDEVTVQWFNEMRLDSSIGNVESNTAGVSNSNFMIPGAVTQTTTTHLQRTYAECQRKFTRGVSA